MPHRLPPRASAPHALVRRLVPRPRPRPRPGRSRSLITILLVGLLCACGTAPAWGAADGDYLNLFTASGSTVKALYQPGAVTLRDGRVLLFGGSALAPQSGSNASVASCELYDPAQGTWSPTGAMLTARRGCGACLLGGGQVMVAGGFDVNGSGTLVLSQAETFDPASGLWSPLPALPTALNDTSLMALPSGDVLALGIAPAGRAAGAVYSAASGSWRAIAPSLVARNDCAYALLPSGLVLVAGGNALSAAPGAATFTPTTSCELYDPVADAWTPTGALLSAHLTCSCAVLPSGAVLIGAGSGASAGAGASAADSELYAAGSWTLTGQLPYPVTQAAICLLSSGDVLSAGGTDGAWVTAAARYSSASGTWSAAVAMADSHFFGALAALPGDQAVIIDGWDEIAGGDGSESFASDGGSEVYQEVLINTPPSFTAGPDQVVLENSGAHTVAGWATAISPGLPAESAQTVTFQVTATNPGLFSIPPMVDGAGTLTYALAADVFGTATVTILAHDDGGTAHGGQDTSTAQTATITAAFVNVPPTFSLGPAQSVPRTAGAQSVSAFLTAVSPGPPTESAFSVQVAVANSANQLFAVQPAIDAQGTLTYTPGDSAGGVATVAVTVTNSGGTADGGVAATTQTVTITIIPVNHVPVFAIGPAVTAPENAPAVSLPGWATGIAPGTFDAGQTVAFTVTTAATALFAVQPQVSPAGTLTFTPAADAVGVATITVTLQDDGGTANGGSDTAAPQTATISLTSVPTLAIAPNAVSTAEIPIAFTFTFSEAVTGFAASAITVVNGTLSAFSGTGTTYQCAITPQAQGAVTVSVAAAACTSVADGNGNAAATATVISDTTPPVLTISPDAQLVTTPTIIFTFSFSATVSGFSAAAITVSNGTPGAFSGAGASYSLVVTPLSDGAVGVAVGVGAGVDAAGNPSTAASATVTSLRSAPTVAISGPGSPTDADPILITYQWSTPVTGFSASGVQVSNGTAGALSGSGAVYTQAITPLADGPVVVDVLAGAAQNAVGTANAAAALTVMSDRTPPTVAITPDGTTTNADPIIVTLAFSEPVTLPSASALAIANGIAGALSGSGALYTLAVTPLVDGAVVITLPAGSCTDLAGNACIAAQATVTSDRSPPLPAISPDGGRVLQSPLAVTISWSKPVMNFTAADVMVTNGAVTAFSGTAARYQLAVVPAGPGQLTIAIPPGVCTDTAGNLNGAAQAAVTYAPPTPPTVTLPSGSVIYQRGGSPVAIDLDAGISDGNGLADFDGGTLGVAISANGEASDLIAIIPGTYGGWAVSVAGQTVVVTPAAGGPAATVALASGGANGVAFQLTLAGGATPAVTVSLLQSIGFSTGDVVDQKATVVKTVAVTFQDGSGVASGFATKSITVIPLFPPPHAGDATVTTLENQPYAGSLNALWTDQGVASPMVTYALVGSPAGGAITAFDTVSGAFIFQPAQDAVSAGSFSYTVTDQYNVSAPAIVTITIGAVDQPPQWTPGRDVTVAEDSPAYTGIGWASGISPGPANQSGQTVSFALLPSAPGLFSVPPAITPDGTLSFTPAPGQFGQALVTAILSNSGGTANGGQDAAPAVVFTITVTRVIQVPTALALTLHTVLGVTVTGRIVLSDPDHQLPPGQPAYALTGISQLGALTVDGTGLVTFTPDQAGSQQLPFTVTVAGMAYPGTIALYDNALVAGRPLVASMPSREQGASGSPWSYALTVDPLSIAAGDALAVRVQSDDAALAAAAITPASGNQFLVAVSALDAGGGPLQSLTLIVTDLTTHQSEVQVLFLVVAPPGGST